MNDRIPCDMIQDLLPLYVDGLTHETTTHEIERHLQQCSRCRESHEQMKGSLGARKEELRQERRGEIVKEGLTKDMDEASLAEFAVAD